MIELYGRDGNKPLHLCFKFDMEQSLNMSRIVVFHKNLLEKCYCNISKTWFTRKCFRHLSCKYHTKNLSRITNLAKIISIKKKGKEGPQEVRKFSKNTKFNKVAGCRENLLANICQNNILAKKKWCTLHFEHTNLYFEHDMALLISRFAFLNMKLHFQCHCSQLWTP